jgi:chromate transport protein ChrA
MSFKTGLNGITELLVMVLMVVLVFALFSNLELMYKLSIGVMVFTLIFLTSVAAQILKQQQEEKKQQ